MRWLVMCLAIGFTSNARADVLLYGGVAGDSCALVLERGIAWADVYMSWIGGYLTARNFERLELYALTKGEHGNYVNLLDMSVQDGLLWVMQYCREHGDAQFLEAVMKLGALGNSRPLW